VTVRVEELPPELVPLDGDLDVALLAGVGTVLDVEEQPVRVHDEADDDDRAQPERQEELLGLRSALSRRKLADDRRVEVGVRLAPVVAVLVNVPQGVRDHHDADEGAEREEDEEDLLEHLGLGLPVGPLL